MDYSSRMIDRCRAQRRSNTRLSSRIQVVMIKRAVSVHRHGPTSPVIVVDSNAVSNGLLP